MEATMLEHHADQMSITGHLRAGKVNKDKTAKTYLVRDGYEVVVTTNQGLITLMPGDQITLNVSKRGKPTGACFIRNCLPLDHIEREIRMDFRGIKRINPRAY